MLTSTEKYFLSLILIFDGHYDHWSMMMENFLRSKEMWNLIVEGISALVHGATVSEAKCKVMEDAKFKYLDIKNFIFQAIDRDIMEMILDKGASKVIWDSMKQKYQGSTKVRRPYLQMLAEEIVRNPRYEEGQKGG